MKMPTWINWKLSLLVAEIVLIMAGATLGLRTLLVLSVFGAVQWTRGYLTGTDEAKRIIVSATAQVDELRDVLAKAQDEIDKLASRLERPNEDPDLP